jgi:hypothetical protein
MTLQYGGKLTEQETAEHKLLEAQKDEIIKQVVACLAKKPTAQIPAALYLFLQDKARKLAEAFDMVQIDAELEEELEEADDEEEEQEEDDEQEADEEEEEDDEDAAEQRAFDEAEAILADAKLDREVMDLLAQHRRLVVKQRGLFGQALMREIGDRL